MVSVDVGICPVIKHNQQGAVVYPVRIMNIKLPRIPFLSCFRPSFASSVAFIKPRLVELVINFECSIWVVTLDGLLI